MPEDLTVGEYIDFLIPGLSERRRPPHWPPDAFAVCASLLHASGGYCAASCEWPPRPTWVRDTIKTGEIWRKNKHQKPPHRIEHVWKAIVKGLPEKVSSLQSNKALCVALIEVIASADEASMGVGIPFDNDPRDAFDEKADILLLTSNKAGAASLCDEVRNSVLRVLPKMHVPSSGFTLKVLTHHLALISNCEIRPFWLIGGTEPKGDNTLDLLLLPWPLKLSSKNFKAVDSKSTTMKNLPRKYGFFKFQHKNAPDLVHRVLKAVEAAADSTTARIDAVVMPELSLSAEEYDILSSMLFRHGIYLIAGIAGTENPDGTTDNAVRFNVPLVAHPLPMHQSKHHRWKLEGNQISAYGLTLPKTKELWEHIPVQDRTLSFVCLREWLALCVLICEDLARPEPVGDILRAVGPNLVIALLLDGPQLEQRWSGRYATSLADDPGSSVLTLTSVGMSSLSKPKGIDRSVKNSGKIALWKDVRGKAHVIDVENGDSALLHIEVKNQEGWTVDGRDGAGMYGFPLLKTVSIFKNGKRVRKYNV